MSFPFLFYQKKIEFFGPMYPKPTALQQTNCFTANQLHAAMSTHYNSDKRRLIKTQAPEIKYNAEKEAQLLTELQTHHPYKNLSVPMFRLFVTLDSCWPGSICVDNEPKEIIVEIGDNEVRITANKEGMFSIRASPNNIVQDVQAGNTNDVLGVVAGIKLKRQLLDREEQ